MSRKLGLTREFPRNLKASVDFALRNVDAGELGRCDSNSFNHRAPGRTAELKNPSSIGWAHRVGDQSLALDPIKVLRMAQYTRIEAAL